jgi:hypothetical protein
VRANIPFGSGRFFHLLRFIGLELLDTATAEFC